MGTKLLTLQWLNPHHFIVLMSLAAGCCFIASYSLSVSMGFVAPVWPAISSTGTRPPASCVFALLLTLSSFFLVACVYIRHGHMEKFLIKDVENHHIINDVAMFLGFLSAFGMTMVGSFQVKFSHVVIWHYLGAFLAFFFGSIYCWLHTYLCYTTGYTTRGVLFFRACLSVFTSAGFMLFILMGQLASSAAGAKVPDKLHWKKGSPGYLVHCVSTFSEWVMGICLMLYFISLFNEFRGLESKAHIKDKTVETDGVTMSAYAS